MQTKATPIALARHGFRAHHTDDVTQLPREGLFDFVVLESFLIAPVAAKRASTIPYDSNTNSGLPPCSGASAKWTASLNLSTGIGWPSGTRSAPLSAS